VALVKEFGVKFEPSFLISLALAVVLVIAVAGGCYFLGYQAGEEHGWDAGRASVVQTQ
jgi:hypothetical protein